MNVSVRRACARHGSLATLPRSDVRCKQHRDLLFAELVKDRHSFRLLLLSMQAHQGHTGLQFAEDFVHVSDLFAAGEENNDLALQMRPDKGEQKIQLLIQVARHVALYER